MATTATLNINVNAGQASKTVDQLNKDVQKLGGSAASLKAELRQTILELQQLQPGSARFQELSVKAGELRDQIADTNAVVGQLAGNVSERLFRGINGVVQVGVAGFQALSAGVALFGGESEELQKTMVRLTALLNLSQALETFAGLDQKLVEIRASFQSLTTATVAQTVATEGEAVATTQAAVATTGLGVAMKALPIVALVAGLATLAYGLFSYVTASEEADKQEKKRKANLEALKKSEKEQAEFVKKESSEFTTLIYQLKATNAGSERRAQLIKQINTEYGTTLKNLSDETLFQDQLNASVQDYITLQYNRFKLNKNQEYIDSQNEKRFNAELKRNKIIANAQDLVNKGIRKSVEDALSYLQFDREALAQAEKDIKDADKALGALGLRREQLTKVEDNLTLSGTRYVEQTKESTKTTDENTEALERQKAVLEDLKNVYDRDKKAYKEYIDFVNKYGAAGGTEVTTFNEITGQQEKVITNTSKYYQDLFDIEKKYRDQQESLIDGAIQKDIKSLDDKFVNQKISEEQYVKQREELIKKGYDKLTQVEKLYYSTLDTQRQQEINDYEQAFQDKQAIAIAQTEVTQLEIERIILDSEKKTALLSVEQMVGTEEEKADKILEIKNSFLSKESDLIRREGDARIKLIEKQRDDELNNAELTTAEKKQIEEKYNKDILEVNTQTQDKIQEAIKDTTEVQKTQLEQLESTLDKVSDYLAAFQNIFGMFEETYTLYLDQENQKRTTAIEDAYNQQLAALDSSLAEGLISRQEYDNQIAQLDQQQAQKKLALDRENFRKTRALNIVNATMDGAQAVLSTFAGTPGGIVIKGIAAALAAVFAATQIALISRQQFTAADGGIVPGNGSGQIDSVSSMLAPGEAVINSRSTNAFLPLLSAINEIGGGRSLMPNLPAVNAGQRFQPVFVNQNQPQLIRAYVVESDISSSQKRVNRIERSTTF